MERLTRVMENSQLYIVDDDKVNHNDHGYTGEAINKLAKFENVYDDIIAKQSEISKELERLKYEGKTHSVKFKELIAKKLTNNNIIILFKTYGLQ